MEEKGSPNVESNKDAVTTSAPLTLAHPNVRITPNKGVCKFILKIIRNPYKLATNTDKTPNVDAKPFLLKFALSGNVKL